MGKQFPLYSAEVYSEQCQESEIRLFQSLAFSQKYYLGCLSRFWISLCSANHKNNQTKEGK